MPHTDDHSHGDGHRHDGRHDHSNGGADTQMHRPARDTHRRTAVALEPTLSLLRLSALQRLTGAAVLAAVLWVVIAAVLR